MSASTCSCHHHPTFASFRWFRYVYKSTGGSLNRGEERKDVLVRAAAHFPASSARGLVPPPCRSQPGQRLAPVPVQKSQNLSTRFGSAGLWDLPNFRRQGPSCQRGASREKSTEYQYPHYRLSLDLGLGLICCNLVSNVDEQIIFCRIAFASRVPLFLLPPSHCTHHPYCSHNLRTMSQRYSLRQTPR